MIERDIKVSPHVNGNMGVISPPPLCRVLSPLHRRKENVFHAKKKRAIIVTATWGNARQPSLKGFHTMAFIPTIGAVEVIVHFTLGGIPCSITLTIGTGGVPPTSTDMVDIANSTFAWVNGNLLDFLSDDITCDGVTCYDLTSSSSPVLNAPQTPVPGTIASASAPLNVALVSSLRTANRGRSGRGRNYIPGLPLNAIPDPGHVTSGLATNILGAYIAGLAAYCLAGFTWDVNSKYTLGAPRLSGFLQQIDAFIVNTELDTKDRTPDH